MTDKVKAPDPKPAEVAPKEEKRPWQRVDADGNPTEPPPGHGGRPQVGEEGWDK